MSLIPLGKHTRHTALDGSAASSCQLRARIGLVFLLAVSLLSAAEAQQTLVLVNGDRLTGMLRKVDGEAWVFRFLGGELSIPAAQVAAFSSPDPIGLRLADGTVTAAAISPMGDGLVLTFVDGGSRAVALSEIEAVGDATDLASLRPVRIGIFSPIFRFWSASGSLGFSDKSGNSRARGLAAGLEVERRTAKDRLTFAAGVNREDSRRGDGEFEQTVGKYYGSLRADIYIETRFFVFAEIRQERDTFQDIDLRSNYSAGLGFQIVSTARTDLRLSGSGGARVENFVVDGSTTSAVLSTGTEFRQQLGPVTFGWKTSWTPNVEDFSDYRFRSQANLTTSVFKGMGFRVGLLNEYDNTPRPGIRKHDMLLTTAITYSVGR